MSALLASDQHEQIQHRWRWGQGTGNSADQTRPARTAMRRLIAVATGVLCSGLWLGLLIATDFNPVTISAGLLGVLYLTGSSPDTIRQREQGPLASAQAARQQQTSLSRKETR